MVGNLSGIGEKSLHRIPKNPEVCSVIPNYTGLYTFYLILFFSGIIFRIYCLSLQYRCRAIKQNGRFDMIIKHLVVPVSLSITVIDDEVPNTKVVEMIQAELVRVNKKLLKSKVYQEFPTQVINPETVETYYKGTYEKR